MNAWLREEPQRRFMLRAFRGENGPGMPPAEGVARALLSDSYKLMDNFDMLLAALDGVKQSGHHPRDGVRPDRPAHVRARRVRGRRHPGPRPAARLPLPVRRPQR
ncbi:hypothetical protein ACFQV4_29845 [Streptomyces thermocarboxydus]